MSVTCENLNRCSAEHKDITISAETLDSTMKIIVPVFPYLSTTDKYKLNTLSHIKCMVIEGNTVSY